MIEWTVCPPIGPRAPTLKPPTAHFHTHFFWLACLTENELRAWFHPLQPKDSLYVRSAPAPGRCPGQRRRSQARFIMASLLLVWRLYQITTIDYACVALRDVVSPCRVTYHLLPNHPIPHNSIRIHPIPLHPIPVTLWCWWWCFCRQASPSPSSLAMTNENQYLLDYFRNFIRK